MFFFLLSIILFKCVENSMIIKTNTNKFYFILDVLKPFVKSFDVQDFDPEEGDFYPVPPRKT